MLRCDPSRRYAMFATPFAYLIDEEGIITHDVAMGVEPILGLLADLRQDRRNTELFTMNLA